jgi:hypothetical protein
VVSGARARARGPLGLTLRRCLAVAALPTLLAAVAGAVLQRVLRPALAGDDAPAAATPWLALPMLTAAFTCALAAVLFWPTFARARPGQQWIDRLQRGRLGGVGGAIAGALLAQLALTLPLTTALAAWLGAPKTAHAHAALVADGDGLLTADRPRVVLRVPGGGPIGEVWLRPQVGLPAGPFVATTLALFADGERLDAAPTFADNRQLARIVFAPRPVRELALERAAGTAPLWFAPDSAVAVGAAARPHVVNGAVVAALALLPTFVALALAALCGLGAALPTVIAVVAGTLVVTTVGGLGVFDPALLALFRGQAAAACWVFPAGAPSLGVGCLAMIVTMFLRARVPR